MTIERRISWDGRPLVANGGDDVDAIASKYDPGEHTVEEVLAHVEDHPDQLADVLDAEQAGKGRVTLLGALGGDETG